MIKQSCVTYMNQEALTICRSGRNPERFFVNALPEKTLCTLHT